MRHFFDKAITYLCLIIGIFGVLDVVILLAIGSVINFGLIFTLLAGTVLTIYSLLKLKGKFSISKIQNIFLRRSIKIGISAFIISFILIEGLIFATVRADNYTDVDYVIILGGGVKGGELSKTLQFRLDKGIEFLKEHPDLKVVVTGGKGFGETISEGEAMCNYLLQNNIPEDKIIVESEATSTMENFKYTKQILEKQTGKSNYKVMVITSDFHMLRSKILASFNGFTPYGIPSKTWIGVFPNCVIREYFAVFKSLIVDIMLRL
ncbi:YdcF family protein [Acetivibrio cellulolyticus]|uniref:YdcF family protein n=1 Tax=Acetivibrio cellulolyticus TaxID=35830 RepID=UPI0001E301C9|nr:YdcF family protein [Acetivibrio cellulolyticus]